jgi:hypothetical protein
VRAEGGPMLFENGRREADRRSLSRALTPGWLTYEG